MVGCTKSTSTIINSILTMIGAMPAVAVRHERRRQEKRGSGSGAGGGAVGLHLHHPLHHGHAGTGTAAGARRYSGALFSRPSQLYMAGGGQWHTCSPCSATPSPGNGGAHLAYEDTPMPEYYLCGKVSALQLVVGSLLLGSIVLVVGLVQLTPGADAADHRFYLLGAGTVLIALGLVLTAVRCCCIHCGVVGVPDSQVVLEPPTGVSSIDMLVKESATSPSELDVLIKDTNHSNSSNESNEDSHHHLHTSAIADNVHHLDVGWIRDTNHANEERQHNGHQNGHHHHINIS